ncbi:MAG: c-type cytochrome [Nitrospiraceae bacterium]|nr:c-type cytochrome [Nitrospiraceae bacterium]
MKTATLASAFFAAMLFLFLPSGASAKGMSGKALFQKNCSDCHVNGGNIINPAYTLHKKDRQKHGVKTVNDIVHIMRHPGPGMHVFTKQMVPDKDAKKIARYILKTFK